MSSEIAIWTGFGGSSFFGGMSMMSRLKFGAKVAAGLLVFFGIMGGLFYWTDRWEHEKALEAARQEYKQRFAAFNDQGFDVTVGGKTFGELLGQFYFVKGGKLYYEMDQQLEPDRWPPLAMEKRTVTMHVFLPDYPMSNEELLAEFERRHWRPATLPELLAFQLVPFVPERFPLNRGEAIVALPKSEIKIFGWDPTTGEPQHGKTLAGPWRIQRVTENSFWIHETYDYGKNKRNGHGDGWPLTWFILAVEK